MNVGGFLSEVGHHPPETAMHAEHKEWLFWQDYIMGSKFRGQYLQIIPQGCAHLIFHRTGNHYFYKRGVISTVHNIIVGRLYVDQVRRGEDFMHREWILCCLVGRV